MGRREEEHAKHAGDIWTDDLEGAEDLALQRRLLSREVPDLIIRLLHTALKTLYLLGSYLELAHVLFNILELLYEL